MLTVQNDRLVFHNTQDCDEAFALIETMLMNRRRDAPYPTGNLFDLYLFFFFLFVIIVIIVAFFQN